MFLSIIIPMYNVEKYIEKCLISCENQDLPKDIYEIICVNDGSPDRSLQIAEGIARQYPNIKILSYPNGGLSVARNNGLAQALGKYVFFIDSDDYIADNCLGGLYKELLKKNIDLLCIQLVHVFEDGRAEKKQRRVCINQVTSGMDVFKRGFYPTMAQLSIYRKQMLIEHNLRFMPGIFHEDAEFMPRVLYYAKRVASYDAYIYYYLQRSGGEGGSITSNYKLKNFIDAIKVCNSLYEFSRGFNKDLIMAYANRVAQIIFTHIERMQSLNKKDQLSIRSLLKENKHIFKFMKKAKLMKYVLAGYLFDFNIKLAISLFSIAFTVTSQHEHRS